MGMTLEQRMIEALKGLYLLSSAPASKLDANPVKHSKSPSRPPSGEGFPLVDEFALRWRRAHREDSKRDCVEAAEEALDRARWAPDPPKGVEPERGSFAWKKQIAEDERPSREVARIFSVSHVTVCDYRRRYRDLRRAV